MEIKSFLASWRLGVGCAFLLLAALFQTNCTGSGAVSPLSPNKATQADSSSAPADSDVVYWNSYPVTFGLTDTLNGVCLVNKKSGWACGNNGVILKYDGDTWAKVQTGLATNQNLYALTFANETEGWVVGSQGTILHYNNGNWTQDSSPTTDNLYSVAVTRSHTVWVVGSNGTILTYNGISWGKVIALSAEAAGASPAAVVEDLNSVGLSDQNNGWAVGNRGTILKFDGQKWQSFPSSATTEKLHSISVISDVQAWIVGEYGTILRFNGTTWNKMGSAFSGFDLYQVYMRSDQDGWATGQDGTLIYYDGSRWISHQKPEGKPALNAISFYKDLGFIVGQNGTILKFQPNGEMAKFSFLFKGEITKKPSKTQPYYTLTYSLMNQSPKISPALTYELPIPEGMEPYQPKLTATPTGTITPVAPPVLTPTPSFTATPITSPVGTKTPAVPTPGTKLTAKTIGSVGGTWTMSDNNLEWEIGTVAASEMKNVTILLQDKKSGKKEYPVVLKAILKSKDKVIAEAAPVTLQKAEAATSDASTAKASVTPSSAGKSSPDDGANQPQSTPTNARPINTPSGH